MGDEGVKAAVGIGVLVLAVLALVGPCSKDEVADPNQELVEMANNALEMAEEARQDVRAYKTSVDRWFFIAFLGIVLGPVIIALLFFRYYTRNQPEDVEVLQQLLQLSSRRAHLPNNLRLRNLKQLGQSDDMEGDGDGQDKW